ncbi:MAG: 1-(5-phosphoribosyl)-5-[(5-phosphoribosylamino)methylideneamino]imidazole-4-carboxamide isomerase [Verrucomicrobia bacterium]|nr:1-(5-phosphoribosyl)-5-[(5-phosphoribosylamino)methylideneamino]imidazole-4-carboxamide isomerase [Verrucomicrobiota bacterium]
MTIYPAIDLKGGRVVRLHQGRADAETVYGKDPASAARDWVGQGAEWLHVVDLDGAFSGEPRNWDCVRAILAAVKIPVQLGGGLRTRQQIAEALAMGVSRCVVGTKACEPSFVKTLVTAFGGKVAVGIDARDGFVAVKGWVEKTTLPAVEFAQQISDLGVRTIIFTDIATDGALTGPNFKAVSAVCAAVKCDIIASGGVSNADDVRRLRELNRLNLTGVIVGKALYDGRVRLPEIL